MSTKWWPGLYVFHFSLFLLFMWMCHVRIGDSPSYREKCWVVCALRRWLLLETPVTFINLPPPIDFRCMYRASLIHSQNWYSCWGWRFYSKVDVFQTITKLHTCMECSFIIKKFWLTKNQCSSNYPNLKDGVLLKVAPNT